MNGLANDCDCNHKSPLLPFSRWPELPPDLQDPNLSGREPSQRVMHTGTAFLQSALARQQTIQGFQREAYTDRPLANDGSSPSTGRPRSVVTRSSSFNSELSVGRLVVSGVQQSARGLVSRSPSLNSEHGLNSSRKLLTEEGLDVLGLRVVERPANRFSEILTESVDVLPSSRYDRDPTVDYAKHKAILYTMATCHSLRLIDDELLGDPLDVKMFNFTGWSFTEGDQGVGAGDDDQDKLRPSVARPPPGREYDIDDEEDDDFGNAMQPNLP